MQCRYASKGDLAAVHQKSEEFLEFGRRLKASDIVLEKSGEAYWELPAGFL